MRYENRLTDSDRERMNGAAASVLAGWEPDHHMVTHADLSLLKHAAVHSIGCTTDDLRDCELEWLDNALTKLVRAAAADSR